MSKYHFLILILFFGFVNTANAQMGFSHEIGVIAGPEFFQSDYGQRSNTETNFGNSGYGIGIVHYLNFSYRADCNCYNPDTYFNDHFKFRSELSYNKTDFQHYGEWVSADKTSTFAKQLRAMKGSTSVTNIGIQLEYFPFSIRDFMATTGSFAPFVSLGGQFSFFNPKAYSDLGPLGSPLTTPTKYINGYTNSSGTVWSVVSSIGTRYKLDEKSDLMFDMRWQYYFSNWVDGLNPNPDVYKENKSNDWMYWINFGYIYYIE